MPIKKGDKVKIEYTGTLEDGKVFDTSEGKQPLECEVGAGQLIKGFDNALLGMEKGEEKEITLPPTEAYGDHNPSLIKKIPKEQLPKEPSPEKGMKLLMKTGDGKQFPATITNIEENEVEIDLNHPLAAKTLKFKIKIVDIS